MPLPWRKYQVSEASPVGIFPPGTLFTLRSWICSYPKSDSSSTVDTNCSPTNPGDCLITERENFHLPCLLPGGYIHHLQLAFPDGLKISYTLGCVDKCNAPCAEGSYTARPYNHSAVRGQRSSPTELPVCEALMWRLCSEFVHSHTPEASQKHIYIV